MNLNKERYRICLQCINEDPSRIARDSFVFLYEGVIQKAIKDNSKWHNFLRGDDELCGGGFNCPYELEHIVCQGDEFLHCQRYSKKEF